jgi:hypothetical protein
MSLFTMTLEFYQIWGLTWSSSQMNVRYLETADLFLDKNDTVLMENVTMMNATYRASYLSGLIEEHEEGLSHKDLITYWTMVGMCCGWAIFYSLPVVLTTTNVGKKKLAFELSEAYRKFLWFMAGAGFLSILKALIKVQFCIPHPAIEKLHPGENLSPLVSLTSPTILCWSPIHLQMVAIALVLLAIFFPSASLTTLFRYDDEDDRCPTQACSVGICGAEGKTGCVLGGEDMRWIHLWRRVEYMVKGMWVFFGYRLVEYGSASAVSLFSGSLIIVVANSMMQPSNLKWVCRWKLLIHMCNCWTTLTCLWANLSDNNDINVHYAMLIPGWLVMVCILGGYEYTVVKSDVFLKPIGDEDNIAACSKEADTLCTEIEFITGIRGWGRHWRIVRLVRLAEHPDLPVKKIAFEACLKLAYHDQMTYERSFYMSLTPCNPTADGMLTTILDCSSGQLASQQCEDQEIKNLAVRALITFLQFNAGNKYGVPITFHQYIMRRDDESGGQITRELVDFCLLDHENEEYERDVVLLLLELCNADSNKLVNVADKLMPKLSVWMETRGFIEQFIACRLVAMASNRFDLAKAIIEGPALKAMITLFHTVAEQTGKFSKESNENGFHKGTLMPPAATFNGTVLPADWRCQAKFMQEKTVKGEGAGAVPLTLTLDKTDLIRIQGEILHLCIQAIVELGGASRAIGRRQILEAGAVDVIASCLDFHSDADEEEEASGIHTDLQTEACRAAHSFLSGRFGMEDIQIDPDFSGYWKLVAAWKEEATLEKDWESELKFDMSLTAIQRRKAHIICAFQQVAHNSVGAIGALSLAPPHPAARTPSPTGPPHCPDTPRRQAIGG